MAGMKTAGLTLLESVEVAAFGGYLEAMRAVLGGPNYIPHFEVRAFALPDKRLPISEMMLLAYPHSKPLETPIKKCSLKILLEVTDPCFSYGAASIMELAAGAAITEELRRGFWRHLGNCIDYEKADVHSTNGQTGLPGYDVYWRFAWLLHNKSQKRCVFLYGASWD